MKNKKLKREICHVCKKPKKSYVVIMDSNPLSFLKYEQAREKGPICERCWRYFCMTDEFHDATKVEYEIARRSQVFSNMVLAWWAKDGKLSTDVTSDKLLNERSWVGTNELRDWARKVYFSDEFRRRVVEFELKGEGKSD